MPVIVCYLYIPSDLLTASPSLDRFSNPLRCTDADKCRSIIYGYQIIEQAAAQGKLHFLFSEDWLTDSLLYIAADPPWFHHAAQQIREDVMRDVRAQVYPLLNQVCPCPPFWGK
jgi:hypothetical protein